MRTTLLAIAVVVGLGLLVPSTATAAVCADYSTQADAQSAADTRDADSDGRYCESLPCPCAGAGGSSSPSAPPAPPPPPPAAKPRNCTRPSAVQRLRFSQAKYPNIRKHMEAAIGRGWPRVMVLNRKGADERRERLLDPVTFPTRAGFDRDEYPAAVGRGRANGTKQGLVRGNGPIGWLADVAYVASSENRSHGASLGAKLRRFCDRTRFRYVFE